MKLNEEEERIFMALRRTHLRHPGLVRKNVAAHLYRRTLTFNQVLAVKSEWLRLGLHEMKGNDHV